MAKYLIYGLADPRTQELRYVGQTCYLPCQRLAQHEHAARRSKDTRRNTQWIRSLQSADVRPEMFEIEGGLTKNEANETESFYISYFRSIGCRLNNHTDGGEGSVGYRHSPEIRAKMSALRTGRKFGEASNVTRRKLSSGQEQELVKLYQTGLSLGAVGERVGLTGGGIRKILIRHSASIRSANTPSILRGVAIRKLNDTDESKVVELYVGGGSSTTLAERFGIDQRTVLHILERHGVKARSPNAPSAARSLGRRKLSDTDETDMVNLYANGASSMILSEQFSVSGRTVLNILKRHGVEARSPNEGRWLTKRQEAAHVCS